MKLARLIAGRRPRRYDVVFYTPWLSSIVSTGQSLPAGGAETQVLILAKWLVRRGMRVAVIVMGDPSEMPDEVEGVSILARPSFQSRGPVLGKVVEVAQLWRSLWRAPSHTLVQRGAGIEVGLNALYARITGRRYVYASAHVADFDASRILAEHSHVLIYELGVRRLAAAVVVQTEEQVQLCERRFSRRPALIKSFAPLADPQTGSPEAFLWVGRLNSYKRPLAYVELARALPQARFWMVGVPTPHRQSDRELIEEVFAEAATVANLELLAPRPHAEIGELMSRAVASVNTSDFEGMPNVLLEAWTRGVPALVLTHDPGGVVGRYGLGGFADGSFERLVELAREQWDSRDQRGELSQRCRDYIQAHHAPENVVEQWLDVLSVTPRAQSSSSEPSGHADTVEGQSMQSVDRPRAVGDRLD